MDNLLKQLQPRMLNASTDAKTKSYGGRTEGTWSFNQGKLYSGVDLRIEAAQALQLELDLACALFNEAQT